MNYNDLALGRIDTVLPDSPIVTYHVEGIGPGRQVNPALRQEIDQTPTALKSDGTLRQIYQKWYLWNDQQARSGIR